jgi:flagellar L-ring protein precursor FlgH
VTAAASLVSRLGLALCAALAGCALPLPAPIVQQPMTARPATVPAAGLADGAIYQAGSDFQPLFEDRRARAVGDTLVIQISENTTASKKEATNVARTQDMSASVGALQGVPGKGLQNLAASGASSNKFDGSGAASAANAFTGIITVTVIRVLANDNLVVSGEKQIALSSGTEYVRFSGVVNPRTITIGNTVDSTQVADARIEYRANGQIQEAQSMGWLARFFMNVLPF